jgi:plastocyanin
MRHSLLSFITAGLSLAIVPLASATTYYTSIPSGYYPVSAPSGYASQNWAANLNNCVQQYLNSQQIQGYNGGYVIQSVSINQGGIQNCLGQYNGGYSQQIQPTVYYKKKTVYVKKVVQPVYSYNTYNPAQYNGNNNYNYNYTYPYAASVTPTYSYNNSNSGNCTYSSNGYTYACNNGYGSNTNTNCAYGNCNSNYNYNTDCNSNNGYNNGYNSSCYNNGYNYNQNQNTYVTITGYSFQPATLYVRRGTTVTWTNQDSQVHTVTSDNNTFHSATLGQGQSYSYTFNSNGTYAYHCQIHPGMYGTVVVTD